MIRILIALAALLLAGPAMAVSAPDDTVGALQRDCRSKKVDLNLYCLGYIGGVLDTMAMNWYAHAREGTQLGRVASRLDVCIIIPGAPAVTVETAVQVFLAWADKHPEEWGSARHSAVVLALNEAWPCK
jgi:hypothetical protein